MAQGPVMPTLLWCSLQVNRISHKHISSTNSSGLVHAQIHTIVFSCISLSSVPGSLSNHLILAGDEALAVTKTNRKPSFVVLQGWFLLQMLHYKHFAG